MQKDKNYKYLEYNDDYRAPEAWKDGGFAMVDKEVIENLRKALKDVIATIGRKMITGKFNLANNSFHIKFMQDMTVI